MNMHKMTEDKASIDDILDSIKNTIQAKGNKAPSQEDIHNNAQLDSEDDAISELKLTDIVNNHEEDDIEPENNIQAEEIQDIDEEALSSIVSKATATHTEALLKDFAETAQTLGQEINVDTNLEKKESKVIEKFILELLEPQIKEWLNTNLPIIVKEVVSEEIKKLVANMNNKD
jgi:hypothetical protein